MKTMMNNQELLVERMADNLPVLRKKLKLSQEELANIIGSSRYTVMLYETKKRKMPWNIFLALCFWFDKNEESAPLLKALEIYTEELDSFVKHEETQELER